MVRDDTDYLSISKSLHIYIYTYMYIIPLIEIDIWSEHELRDPVFFCQSHDVVSRRR